LLSQLYALSAHLVIGALAQLLDELQSLFLRIAHNSEKGVGDNSGSMDARRAVDEHSLRATPEKRTQLQQLHPEHLKSLFVAYKRCVRTP